MSRRNFIVVDDMAFLGGQVVNLVCKYYSSKKNYDYEIKHFLNDNHFEEAFSYIGNRYADIDVLFSDQNLVGGKGTDLFKITNKDFDSDFKNIKCKTQIFNVMHSNEDRRFTQHQSDYRVLYDYFINSDLEAEKYINEFLDFYEEKIILIKEHGNTVYRSHLYEQSLLQSISSDSIEFDNKTIQFKDIQFFVMDKNHNNSDYYYCYYDDGNKIIRSKNSKKLTINEKLRNLSFFTGNLKEEYNEKFKVNPLWVSTVDKSNSIVKLIPRYNVQFEISYERLTAEENLLDKNLDIFFTK